MSFIRKSAVIGPLSMFLCCQIVLAEQPAAFTIAVVRGDGAVNFVKQKPASVPVVRVADASGRGVAGAKVSFQAPSSGPSASFKGALMYTAMTRADGTAKAEGFMPNAETGPFTVDVTAEYDGQTAQGQLSQNNVAPPAAKANHHHMALKIAIGCAAVVGFGFILYYEFIAKDKPYGQR